jgi:hypothetical protein
MNKKKEQQITAREWKYSTNVNWHSQSKTEESKGCNYYLPDLKSDCNIGVKKKEQQISSDSFLTIY